MPKQSDTRRGVTDEPLDRLGANRRDRLGRRARRGDSLMLPAHVESSIRKTSLCWQWVGYTTEAGYGVVSIADKTYRAHRVVYESARGRVPAGMQLDHLCRNRDCVNPEHLEPVTALQNTMRGEGPAAINAAKTRCPKHGTPYLPLKCRRERVCPECRRINGRRHDRKRSPRVR